MKILFASANSAHAYMDIEREHRSLQQFAESGKHELRVLPAAEIADLRDALSPSDSSLCFDILHFSGHVTEDEGLQLRGSGRRKDYLATAALKDLLRNSSVTLVILNACNSGTLAKSICDVVPAAIGTTHAIRDVVARQFTRNFYAALNEMASVKTAFEIAVKKGKQGQPAFIHAGEDVAIGAN
ncbi:MAG: CHAT domain-containing protein [Woeseia sp.]|nr:CHAT domain-containing protein [Woeseia sp.]NNE60639.1 CHAT domain-containing protein [Woeseia sp.]NNL53545.1 CHAT domain-containing protein [Woeseia sp.]